MLKKRPIGDNEFEDLSDIDPDTSDEKLDNLSSDKDEDSEILVILLVLNAIGSSILNF